MYITYESHRYIPAPGFEPSTTAGEAIILSFIKVQVFLTAKVPLVN